MTAEQFSLPDISRPGQVKVRRSLVGAADDRSLPEAGHAVAVTLEPVGLGHADAAAGRRRRHGRDGLDRPAVTEVTAGRLMTSGSRLNLAGFSAVPR